MGLFFKRKKRKKSNMPKVQTASSVVSSKHPFSEIDNYIPLVDAEYSLYSSLREAVPIVDAAINKTVRLLGTFKVVSENKNLEDMLNKFIGNVGVNGYGKGMHSFIYAYFDQLLTYGTAVGEMVLSNDNSYVKELYNASLKDVTLKYGDSPLEVLVCRRDHENEVLRYQSLICKSLLKPEPGTIKGTSVLKGLPFISSILLKILNTIGTNWERVGNVRFAVTYKPTENNGQAYSKERAMEIADQWSKAMRDTDNICDFVSVGDVSIKVIGADNQILDCDVPVRNILEQIVAKLSIPPFILGLSWSSTERMSSQQADILTSELDYYRLLINSVIKKICNMHLRLTGYCGDYSIEWNNINLQDEVEHAKARLANAQALEIEEAFENLKDKSSAECIHREALEVE